MSQVILRVPHDHLVSTEYAREGSLSCSLPNLTRSLVIMIHNAARSRHNDQFCRPCLHIYHGIVEEEDSRSFLLKMSLVV